MKTAPKFFLSFEIGNAAFDDSTEAEICSILRTTARRIERGFSSGAIYDSNGNRIGRYEWEKRT